MDISSVTSTGYAQKNPTQQSREVRQSTQANGVEEKIQQRFQTQGRHNAKARIAQAAFQDSVGTSERAKYESGVDQMVRAVARREADNQWESTDTDQANQARRDRHTEQTSESSLTSGRDDFIRERVDAAYAETEHRQRPVRSSSDDTTRAEQANERTVRQQQQGAEVYRDSERSGIDRTVELVI